MMKTISLAALALIAATTAGFARDCKGTIVSVDNKITVSASCWTSDPGFKELIARACGEGDACEVVGNFDRSGKITRVSFARGPKGISFKMKPCPNCVEGVKKALDEPSNRVVNEDEVRKLCPNPNARCMARDNPDFYKDSDPALYNRITKPARP